jgi:hypothetical protein
MCLAGAEHAGRPLAAAYAQLGQLDSAKAQAAEVLRVEPFFTINGSPPVSALKRPDDIEHVSNGLRGRTAPCVRTVRFPKTSSRTGKHRNFLSATTLEIGTERTRLCTKQLR